MQLQSKTFDPVLGMHIHLIVYPGPPPAPPVILPGAVISIGFVKPDLAAMVMDFACAAIGFPQPDTSVQVHGCNATTTGSDVMMVHAAPLGGPLAPGQDVVGDSKFYFGSPDVLIGSDAKWAVRLVEMGFGCAVVGRLPPDVVITLQFDVLSGRQSSFDVGSFVSDLVSFAVGQVGQYAGEAWAEVIKLVWSCRDEIVAFVENPSEETAAALAEKVGEEVLADLIDGVVEGAIGAVLGPLVQESVKGLAGRGVRRWRPRRPGLRRRGASAR